MKIISPFNFKRTKGIVWVCDLTKSSTYLNNNESIDDIEAFIPRLYFVSKLLVESFGGAFVKWTGDGFLAFFDVELDRQKEEIAKKIYLAAWHLSFMTNVTQLGLSPKKKFKIRHGITYERDALLMNIEHEKETTSWDIIGRSVVLAFRLSGIQSEFPSIVTVKDLLESPNNEFIKWIPTLEDKLRYFKGENYGTQSIYISKNNIKKSKNLLTATRAAQKTIKKVELNSTPEPNNPLYVFTKKMQQGPVWCNEIIKIEIEFIKNEFIGSLKTLIKIVGKSNTNTQQ